MMKLRFAAICPKINTVIAIPMFEGDDISTVLAGYDANSIAIGAAAAGAARFGGEANALVDFVLPAAGADEAQRVALIGLGKVEDVSALSIQATGGALVGRYQTSGAVSLCLDFTELNGRLSDDLAAAMAFGAIQRSWRIDRYRTRMPDKQKPTMTELVIVGADGAGAAANCYVGVANGVALTRELVSEPPNVIYPESFVARCEEAFKGTGAVIKVLNEAEMAKLGMGALLGVGQGSHKESRLLAIEWDGTDGAMATPVAFVGKGVTFDTGGISLKPGPGMEDMKWDMGGAGAVAGAMLALASRKAKAHVVGICGLVENMPDGNAIRPGDILTSMSGQTIEVLNTDAEGRLVLCDALHWAQETYKPDVVVDLATLTGAMIISLGHEYGGMFSNDDGLADQLFTAGKESGEPVWRFPLGAAYDKQIDSPIADMKNIGSKGAGSITAAQFLQRFIQDGVKWAHLDIAGMVWADKPGPVWDKGATAYGVRLLDRFIADNFEK